MIFGPLGIAVLVCAATYALHAGSGLIPNPPNAPETPALLTGFVVAVFAVLFLFQALLWRASRHPLGRRLYVHALNGFYLGTLANRALGLLWPRHPMS